MTDTAVNDEMTILTAEQFARQVDRQERRRAHQLRWEQARLDHDVRWQRIWAAVLAVVILGGLALIAFIVHAISTEHAREAEVTHLHRVTVWCYADPNSDRGTSTVTGAPDDVRGFCPDAYGGYTAGG